MAFRVETQMKGGRAIAYLHDDSTRSSAAIIPSYGFNLFDLRLPVGQEVVPILSAAADFAENPKRPGRNGIPILFPYPNRVRDGKYSFGGKSYQLPITHAPNAIHGFALDASWDVVEHRAADDEAYIVGRYQISKQSPQFQECWPTDAVLQVRYGLAGRRLSMTVTVSNPTSDVLPYGFGIHPYFHLPFTRGGDLAQTKVIIPASKTWVLQDFLPTGEIQGVDARLDFRQGQPIKGLKLDDVLTGLEFEGERGVCRLLDLEKKAEFRLGYDRNFRELVAYTPSDAPDVIALEPYTQTTDAINLQAKGIDAGLRTLGHGKHDVLRITMETLG